MNWLFVLASFWAGLGVFAIVLQINEWLLNRNKPLEDWHWAGDDFPKDVGWVRSLGPNAPQVSEPKSAADSPSE